MRSGSLLKKVNLFWKIFLKDFFELNSNIFAKAHSLTFFTFKFSLIGAKRIQLNKFFPSFFANPIFSLYRFLFQQPNAFFVLFQFYNFPHILLIYI